MLLFFFCCRRFTSNGMTANECHIGRIWGKTKHTYETTNKTNVLEYMFVWREREIRDTVWKKKWEWVIEWKIWREKERCHFYSYDKNISPLGKCSFLLLPHLCTSCSTRGQYSKTKFAFTAAFVQIHQTYYNGMYICVWHKTKLFHFTTATDVLFFFKLNFFSPLSNKHREKERRMGNSAVFALLYNKSGCVTSESTSF